MTHYIIDSIIEEFDEYLDIDTFTTIINKKCQGLSQEARTSQGLDDIFQCYEDYRHRRNMYELELARMRTREAFGMMWY